MEKITLKNVISLRVKTANICNQANMEIMAFCIFHTLSLLYLGKNKKIFKKTKNFNLESMQNITLNFFYRFKSDRLKNQNSKYSQSCNNENDGILSKVAPTKRPRKIHYREKKNVTANCFRGNHGNASRWKFVNRTLISSFSMII